jgi:DNA adenine methylase
MIAETTIKRPALRYHGGKWRMAPWLISYFPPHRTYVEPFGGAASVLLQKPRAYAEVYNDLDGEIVNLFRVLRDPCQAREMERLLILTPYARTEFEQSYLTADDPIEQARRTVIRSFMGFGSTLTGKWTTGFRNDVTRSGTTPADDWKNYPDLVKLLAERLQGVVIENRPADQVIEQFDRETTLFYIDPPYVSETRNDRWAGKAYRHEMTDEDHVQLASRLHSLKGMVIISGYNCDLYNGLYADWKKVEKEVRADHALKRVESLWLNPRASQAQSQQSLFEVQLCTP